MDESVYMDNPSEVKVIRVFKIDVLTAISKRKKAFTQSGINEMTKINRDLLFIL